MKSTSLRHAELKEFLSQPQSVRGIFIHDRDQLVVSYAMVGGTLQPKSRYGDMTWHLSGATTNLPPSLHKLYFEDVPGQFLAMTKAVLFRYWMRGLEGKKRPGISAARKLLLHVKEFLLHISGLGVHRLSDVTPTHCATFVTTAKSPRRVDVNKGLLAKTTLEAKYMAIEALFSLSRYSDDPMPSHPWIDSSARHLAGRTGRGIGKDESARTPLIPDPVFVGLFQAAWRLIESASEMLDIRDIVEQTCPLHADLPKATKGQRRRVALKKTSWEGDLDALNEALNRVRVACYVVVASLSGCRNHELANLQSGAYFSSVDESGEVFWWMRSRSEKTDEGDTAWMIPTVAVEALKVLERLAQPHQEGMRRRVETLQAANPSDPAISDVKRDINAIFLSAKSLTGGVARTMTVHACNRQLKDFAKWVGVEWDLTTHQFRRKFANYAARSQFGDLRYLREHFKHWSIDMTLGYALNESQEMSLYLEIQDELDDLKMEVVDTWLNPSEALAGGYGRSLASWRGRSDSVVIFKDRAQMVRSIAMSTAIRSNGHAWCTADDNLCIGNDLERTRCAGCGNAVIGSRHARLYQRLYDDLQQVSLCPDIGDGGRARVQRDLERYRDVLCSLGHDPSQHAKDVA